MNQVRIYHPALDTHVSVPESAVDIHRVSGWVPADEHVPLAEEPLAETAVEPAAENAPEAEEKKPGKPKAPAAAKDKE